MARCNRTLILASMVMMIAGCATLYTDYETPSVTVSTIRALPSDSIAPRFEIGLHIVNPNRSPLKLHGIAYSLKLDGYKILTGVANDLPTIDGYAEGDVILVASTSLLSSMRFFADLMNVQRDRIAYELNAKLDLGGLRPNVHVGEKGEIRLTDLSGQTR
ncbi:LEA type 2 family protein [uncultured Desulfosarcina sp.]|uniref:LEA type 2 family protein n=1 Tax=uncultured Desulfosarcina sp. TaxID=218289 RepID=UPI0029C6B3CA|nr:LEA type 2 family protein [uncultured Desulfosarcina sp.]